MSFDSYDDEDIEQNIVLLASNFKKILKLKQKMGTI